MITKLPLQETMASTGVVCGGGLLCLFGVGMLGKSVKKQRAAVNKRYGGDKAKSKGKKDE